MRPFVLASLAVLALIAAPSRAQAPVIDFERAAKEFVREHKLSAPTPDALQYEALLEQAFLVIDLGVFQVLFPRARVAERAGELCGATTSLCGAQLTLLEWIKPAAADQKALRADLAAIQTWLNSWKPAQVSKLGDAKGRDLAQLLGANEATQAALQRAAQALRSAAPFGTPRAEATPARLVLLPTRKDFLEFLALLGWILPDQRGHYWLDGAADWSQSFYNSDQLIALEYALPGHKPEDYVSGMPIKEDDVGVMQQQIVQLALNSWMDVLFQGRVPAAFCQGLSMNLVIDQFGEIRTRVDGDLRTRSAQERDVFIPGGDPDGGNLPKNSAETRWRQARGKDHWVSQLRGAQKEGEELDRTAKPKHAAFSVRDDSGGKKQLVMAPFFGGSSAKPPPDSFAGDFAEFVRAYKSAFIHWMQTKGAGNEKGSREAFARLLLDLAKPETKDFEALFAARYDGKPLSGTPAEKECLEGQFLLWLQKQK